MSRTALLPLDLTKEIRGLAGAWLACLVALVVPAVSGVRVLGGLDLPAYFLGAAALGALSIGHEYRHRTLTLLLSHPARRERLLLLKLGVLAAMLLALYGVADAVDVRAPELERLPSFLLLPMLWALSVAPWLTMLCRSPLAGTVLAIALPPWLLLLSELLYLAMYGRGPGADVEAAIMWWGTLGVSAFGAVMTWRMFMRLEAIDDGGPEVQPPQWLRRRTTAGSAASALTRRHAVWLLVKKEIWLQKTALAVAALYMLGCLAFVSINPWLALGSSVPDGGDILAVLTFCYGALIAVLIGSLASAEERQLGTLDWQVLLPVATWKQWIVKVGTALGLALLLTIGLTGLLLAAINPAADMALLLERAPQFAVGVAVLTVISLYVSSLCTSGVQALLISVPAIFALVLPVMMVVQWLEFHVMYMVVSARWSSEQAWQRFGISLVDRSRLMSLLELLLVAAILTVVLRVALANHRSAEPLGGRATQVIMMGICLMIGALLLAGMAVLA